MAAEAEVSGENDFAAGFGVPATTQDGGTDPDDPEKDATALDTGTTTETSPKGEKSEAHLEQELSTLRGKYDAEVPRLHDEVKAANERAAKAEAALKAKDEAEAQARADADYRDPDSFVALRDPEAAPIIAKAVEEFVEARLSRAIAKLPKAAAPAAVDKDEIVDTAVRRAMHFSAIAARHPDFDNVVGSAKFKQHLSALPAVDREKAQAVVAKGTATEVIGLLDTYKKANGIAIYDSDVVTSRSTAPKLGGGAPDAGKDDFNAGFNLKDRK
jgi:hypothetical protein